MRVVFALIYIIFLTSCTSVSITDRKQLMILGDDVIYPEAFKAYKDFKSKAKLIESGEEIDQINKVTSNLKTAIKNYYKSKGQMDPTANFAWEVVLVDNKDVKNAWCMPGGKMAVYSGKLEITNNGIKNNSNFRSGKKSLFSTFLAPIDFIYKTQWILTILKIVQNLHFEMHLDSRSILLFFARSTRALYVYANAYFS